MLLEREKRLNIAKNGYLFNSLDDHSLVGPSWAAIYVSIKGDVIDTYSIRASFLPLPLTFLLSLAISISLIIVESLIARKENLNCLLDSRSREDLIPYLSLAPKESRS